MSDDLKQVRAQLAHQVQAIEDKRKVLKDAADHIRQVILDLTNVEAGIAAPSTANAYRYTATLPSGNQDKLLFLVKAVEDYYSDVREWPTFAQLIRKSGDDVVGYLIDGGILIGEGRSAGKIRSDLEQTYLAALKEERLQVLDDADFDPKNKADRELYRGRIRPKEDFWEQVKSGKIRIRNSA